MMTAYNQGSPSRAHCDLVDARWLNKMEGDISRLPFLSFTIRHRQLGWFLCGLAVNLGFEGLLAANINLDLLGLGFGLLGEVDLQHALIIVGAHLPWIHRTGQRERAGEASVLPLNATEVLFFLFLLELALAVDGEGVVFDADINVFFVDCKVENSRTGSQRVNTVITQFLLQSGQSKRKHFRWADLVQET